MMKTVLLTSLLFASLPCISHAQGMSECDLIDCDTDAECAEGLWCAEEHREELLAANMNFRTAYCTDLAGFGPSLELCFDPLRLGPTDTNAAEETEEIVTTTRPQPITTTTASPPDLEPRMSPIVSTISYFFIIALIAACTFGCYLRFKKNQQDEEITPDSVKSTSDEELGMNSIEEEEEDGSGVDFYEEEEVIVIDKL